MQQVEDAEKSYIETDIQENKDENDGNPSWFCYQVLQVLFVSTIPLLSFYMQDRRKDLFIFADTIEQPIDKKYTDVLKQYFGYKKFRP